jgi:hypothetical protein
MKYNAVPFLIFICCLPDAEQAHSFNVSYVVSGDRAASLSLSGRRRRLDATVHWWHQLLWLAEDCMAMHEYM